MLILPPQSILMPPRFPNGYDGGLPSPDELLAQVTDPVLREMMRLHIADKDKSIGKLEKNNEKLLGEKKALEAGRPDPDDLSPVRLTRSEAQDHAKYRAAKEQAAKRGVTVEIVDDSHVQRTLVGAVRFVHDDIYYASHEHVRASGPSSLKREANGRRIVMFEAAEDLPAAARAAMPE